MKKIGLIGGMSFESTVTYYQGINQIINQKLGGLHSAKILLESVDFADIEKCQKQNEWDKAADILATCAQNLESSGAHCVLICTNTMHKVAPEVQDKINIPLIHIAKTTLIQLKEKNISKVGLLGTRYTMKEDFYKEVIKADGVDVVIPNDEDVEFVNHVIFNELCKGQVKEESKERYLKIIESLVEQGAQGVILGCTEIGLLIEQKDTPTPLFDTTLIHIDAAVKFALADS